jgi:hypothetical protein
MVCGVVIAAWLVALAVNAPARGAITLYVSPRGNDSWSGRLPDPASGDGPLATIAGARDIIRRMKAGGALKGAVNVQLRGGHYTLNEPVKFDYRDSGSADSPVTYEAYRGEQPVISKLVLPCVGI